MPIPKVVLPKVTPSQIPWFKQYALIISLIFALILALTIYIGWNSKDYLFYPPVSPTTISQYMDSYKNRQVTLQGTYLPFSLVIKPLCVVEGGTVKYPELRSDYKPLNASWGVYDQSIPLAVKVVASNGQELPLDPTFKEGEKVNLKGIIRLTTTPDECNKDVNYQSAYLEITPEVIGVNDPTKQKRD